MSQFLERLCYSSKAIRPAKGIHARTNVYQEVLGRTGILLSTYGETN